ncbi:PilN domain-containing protein [Hydrogenophaga sp.]|uniref:PilN domain-containing protein n=1 Tax=Hydrogenophaga sp. TaxID=1904254 RepID=UPI0019C2CE8B|nr:PilN domain-containing protein [Hydrogenophaga sp.]MBD3893440.1 fimbrial protein [Hydrogenophaga sp.]
MILINLLPHREAARKRQKDQFFTQLGLFALLGGVICGAVFTWYQREIAAQQGRNAFLQTEIAKLDLEIKDIAGLQQEISALRARQSAVENLQGDRNLPVHLLSELVAQLPDGVYLSGIREENRVVLLTGVAQSQERVSELLRNLANHSPWLSRPDLVEIVAANVALSAREQRRVSNFTIRVTLVHPAAAPAPAGAAAPVAPGKV